MFVLHPAIIYNIAAHVSYMASGVKKYIYMVTFFFPFLLFYQSFVLLCTIFDLFCTNTLDEIHVYPHHTHHSLYLWVFFLFLFSHVCYFQHYETMYGILMPYYTIAACVSYKPTRTVCTRLTCLFFFISHFEQFRNHI